MHNLAARAVDVREARNRLVAALQGVSLDVKLDAPMELGADDLMPAQLLEIEQWHTRRSSHRGLESLR